MQYISFRMLERDEYDVVYDWRTEICDKNLFSKVLHVIYKKCKFCTVVKFQIASTLSKQLQSMGTILNDKRVTQYKIWDHPKQTNRRLRYPLFSAKFLPGEYQKGEKFKLSAETCVTHHSTRPFTLITKIHMATSAIRKLAQYRVLKRKYAIIKTLAKWAVFYATRRGLTTWLRICKYYMALPWNS